MNELMNVGEGGLSPVEDLAQQAQYYSQRTAFDMLQLGRVLTQAKELVAQGEWMDWVDKNAGLDIRGAQYFMQCYAKYGLDPEKAKLGKSKLIAMLPMTDKERDKLMANNDVSAMSVRELKEAVRKAREEEQEKAREAVEVMRQGNLIELAKQKEAADKALKEAMEKAEAEKALELEQLVITKDGEIKTRMRLRDEQIAAQKAQIDAVKAEAEELRQKLATAEETAKEATRTAIDGARDISRRSAEVEAEARKLRAEMAEKDALLAEMQEQYNEIQQQYLNAQSAIAKGDAERATSDILSAEAVQDACRVFMGQVGRVPFMHGAFATMDEMERDGYRQSILMVLDWAKKSLNTLETVKETVNGNWGVVE